MVMKMLTMTHDVNDEYDGMMRTMSLPSGQREEEVEEED